MRTKTVAMALLLGSGVASCVATETTSPRLTGEGTAALLQRGGHDGLTLHPRGFGPKAYAAWKAKEGRDDSGGNADHALYFQKMVPTSVVAAGIAEISGLDGMLFTDITGLSWERRVDGHCGAGAPRWTIAVSEGEDRGFLFLGCAAALHTPAGTDDEGRAWMRDTYPAAHITFALEMGLATLTNPAVDLDAARIDALYIIFDEGTDVGPGYVYLDNITVEAGGQTTVFTSPRDNSR